MDSSKGESTKCKVCNSEMSPHFMARGFWIFRCPKCTFEQVKLYESSETVSYDSEYFVNNKYRDLVTLNLENKRRIRIIQKYLSNNDKVLDFGCATGEFVDYAKNDFCMFGCDVSYDAINIAKAKYPDISKHLYNLDEFSLSEEVYSAVVLWDVIEHIEYPFELICRLRDKITSGGYLVMSTPNIGAIFAKITKSLWPFMTPPEHLCFFTKKSLYYIAKKTGFTVLKWKTKGKWANLGFILYKFNRVSKIKIPKQLIQLFSKGIFSKIRIYVPTHDVQYVIMKKNG